MAETGNPTRRRLWRWLGVLLVLAVLAAAGGVLFLPDLLPSAAVRRKVAEILTERLGRKVTVTSARLSWSEGLTAWGVRVRRRDGEGLLARADRVAIVFGPTEAARAAAGHEVPLEAVRLEGLELWLVVDEQGRWNVADLARGKPMEVGVVRLGEARIHFENRRTDRQLDFENVNATIGKLASTGNAYVSLSADLCRAAAADPASCGHVVLTANLNRLAAGGDEPPIGSVKAEWTDLPWDRVASAVTTRPPLAGWVDATSGRFSATFGRAAWSAEGAVQATSRALAPETADGSGTPAEAEPLTAVLGFRIHQPSATGPLTLDLVKVSAPGLVLKVTGALEPAPAEDERGTPAPGLPPWGRHRGRLAAEATVTWFPLCHNLAPLAPLAKTFNRLTGKARLALDVDLERTGLRLAGSADLTDTVMASGGFVAKGEHDRLRARFEARCDARLRRADPVSLDLVTDAGTVHVEGALPLAGLREAVYPGRAPGGEEPPAGHPLAGAAMTLTAQVRDTRALLRLMPGVAAGLGPLAVDGPCRVDFALRPFGPAEASTPAAQDAPPAPEGAAAPPAQTRKRRSGGPVWTTALRADLTRTRLRMPRGVRKPADMPMTVDLDAVLRPDQRRSDVRGLTLRLAEGEIDWTGEARIDWPRKEGEQPVGRFEGTLAIRQAASLGRVLAPGRFAQDPPVSGNASVGVAADLADGRLRTRMEADLEPMQVSLAEYLVKPPGEPASLAVTTLWHPGGWNRVQGEAELELPGVRLSALGQAILVARWQDLAAGPDAAAPETAAPEEPADPGGPPGPDTGAAGAEGDRPAPDRPTSSIAVTLGETSTVEVKAEVADLGRAVALSPLLEKGLKAYRVWGRADGRAVLSIGQESIEATGDLDLTRADLDLGRALTKPAGLALSTRLVCHLEPTRRGRVDLHLATAEVRLGESTTSGTGLVRLDPGPLVAPLASEGRLAASVEKVDVNVRAVWKHGPALRRALPWLAPLHKRCDLEGRTRWDLALSGTPTVGRVRLTLDADACRVSAPGRPEEGGGPVTVKETGTPASARVDLRYGDVPGEMALEDLEVSLADATATASGRFLFDEPSLLVPDPPTAWTLHAEGRVPDAAILASLLPGRLADLQPTGSVTVDLRAAADGNATEIESCRLVFDDARVRWLGRPVRLDGPVAYDYERLETEGLRLQMGNSDVRLVAYVARPDDNPTGSLIVRGPALDLAEVQEMIRKTAATLPAENPGPQDEGADADRASQRLGERLRRLLAEAQLSADVGLDRVSLVVPDWQTRYDLEGLEAEGRLADRRLVLPRFACRLNRGTVTGRMRLDFRQDVPVLHVTYDARNLAVDENLKPFIETTFPGMKVFGTLSTRATVTRPLAEGAHPVGSGRTVLTDGLLEGPAAPDYITRLLPGLKLTRYRFHRMSNVFENLPNGDTTNEMLFDGKAYDLFMSGVTHADGQTHYTVGVDLSVSLGSETISRTLGQGKLPLMYYDGRIVGSKWAEQRPSYLLPHDFAYKVFLQRNLLLRLIRSIGQPEPEIEKPLVVPEQERRPEPRP